MTDGGRPRAGSWARLLATAGSLGLLAAVMLLLLTPGADDVRAVVEPFGWWAPAAYVVVSVILGLAFVPGAALATMGGALFGTGVGLVCSITAATLTSVAALLVARHAGRRAVEDVSGPRATALAGMAQRHGTLVVVLQRLMPGVPDAPFSYLFGAVGLRVRHITLGTLAGAAPRAFSYAALGDAAVRGDARLAAVALAVGTVVAAAGLVSGWVLVRRGRRAERDALERDPEPATGPDRVSPEPTP